MTSVSSIVEGTVDISAPEGSGTSTVSYLNRPAVAGANGTPMLCVHGFLDSARAWLDLYATLPRDRQVVAITLRGFGDSSKNGPFTIESYCDDVVKVMDALSMPKVILMGHSMGTMISTLLASRHGDRVEGLVLCGAGAHGHELSWPEHASFKDAQHPLSEQQKRDLCEFQEGAAPDSQTMRETFKASPQAIYDAWTSITTDDHQTALLAIVAPILILWGTEDDTFLEKMQWELKANLIKSKPTFIEVPGALHSSLIAGQLGRRCGAFIGAWCFTTPGIDGVI